MSTKDNTWTRRWKNWVKPTRVPNVWQIKSGGHLVRARITDPTTGRMIEIKRVLPKADEATAFKWLADERKRVQAGVLQVQRPSVRFADYAVSLFEKKVAPGGSIRSSAGRTRWRSTLEHLIAGTYIEQSKKRVQGFGEIYVDKLHLTHVDEWKRGISELIAGGDYAPTTANSWLSILRVIMKAAKRELGLVHLATDGVENFDVSEHAVYTEEAPNALPAERVGEFLELLRRLHPAHYAMAYLGFVTGLRPSSLRPLRRRGEHADVLWEKKRVLVRRSQTRGPEVMNTTKQKRRYAIDLPEDVMKVLEWHVQAQLATPEQQESDLLFPSITGGFRAPTVLNKPFADVAEEMELGYAFTQRGMRRTFNDLARHARIESIVTRSISGHLTERMQHHYSTVASEEQRTSIAKVIDLFSPRASEENGARGAVRN
jgi:integrase